MASRPKTRSESREKSATGGCLEARRLSRVPGEHLTAVQLAVVRFAVRSPLCITVQASAACSRPRAAWTQTFVGDALRFHGENSLLV